MKQIQVVQSKYNIANCYLKEQLFISEKPWSISKHNNGIIISRQIIPLYQYLPLSLLLEYLKWLQIFPL